MKILKTVIKIIVFWLLVPFMLLVCAYQINIAVFGEIELSFYLIEILPVPLVTIAFAFMVLRDCWLAYLSWVALLVLYVFIYRRTKKLLIKMIIWSRG